MNYAELVKNLRESCLHENCILCQNAADAIETLLSGHIFTGFGIAHDPTNPMKKVFVGDDLVAESGPGWRINDVLLDGWMRGENHDRALVVFVRDKEEEAE